MRGHNLVQHHPKIPRAISKKEATGDKERLCHSEIGPLIPR